MTVVARRMVNFVLSSRASVNPARNNVEGFIVPSETFQVGQFARPKEVFFLDIETKPSRSGNNISKKYDKDSIFS